MRSQPKLKAPTLEALKEKAKELHGPNARIVRAVKVTTEGIGGLFGGSHVEGFVEIVAPAAEQPAPVPHGFANLTGIEALLAHAEAGDAELSEVPLPAVSTGGEDFGKLMNSLNAELVDVTPPPPALLAAAGDLVLVAGPGDTSLPTAKAMADLVGAKLYTSGLIMTPAVPAVEGPLQVMEARAGGVIAGKPVVIAFGLGNHGWAGASAASAAALKADQAWLVVDARHKHDDTAAWVKAARSRLAVMALAVTGAGETATPSTINSLGIPVGWAEDAPTPTSTLTDPGN